VFFNSLCVSPTRRYALFLVRCPQPSEAVSPLFAARHIIMALIFGVYLTSASGSETRQQPETSRRDMLMISRKLDDIVNVVNAIQQKVANIERNLQDRSGYFENALTTSASNIVPGADDLSEDHLRLLRCNPMVTTDEDWEELDNMLIESGQHGRFFRSFVQTLKDRLVDRTDLNKTANATLRALVSESFLAERLTMAGYKKGKCHIEWCCYYVDVHCQLSVHSQ
jgi:hypothetical protein